ncbi:MAG: PEP-CTERM sorting domain-containing protein [Phycisphaerae bacterium]
MRSRRVSALIIMATLLTTNCLAVFSTNGFASSELYSTSGTYTVIDGLDLDGGHLYFGNFDKIRSLNLSDNSVTVVGNVGPNAGNSIMARHAGLTYTAFGTSYNSPYPYSMGYIDSTGTYHEQLEEDGIYDAAVNSQGDCFIVANPDALGSKIFSYDWDSGTTTLVADIGGYSGGLAFDNTGNLYYADQGISGSRDGSILMFTAAQVAVGGLDIGDAYSTFDITARFIGFDEEGLFYAATDYGATLSSYDIENQSLINEIAYGSIGKFLLDGDSIYAVDTDWSNYYSTIQMITVPEPATAAMLSFAFMWLRRRRG